MRGALGCGAAWGPHPIAPTLVFEVAVPEDGALLPFYISAAGSALPSSGTGLWGGGLWGAHGVPAEPPGTAAGFRCPSLPFLSRFSPAEQLQWGLQWGLPLLCAPRVL